MEGSAGITAAERNRAMRNKNAGPAGTRVGRPARARRDIPLSHPDRSNRVKRFAGNAPTVIR
jgi:hypothetical protein